MSSLLETSVLYSLQEHFGTEKVKLLPGQVPFGVFPALHAAFGNIELYDDGEELTIVLGSFTHIHFGTPSVNTTEIQSAERVADELVEFLNDILSDQVAFHGSHEFGGGYHYLDGESSQDVDQRYYVWSGPLKSLQ